MKMYKKLIRRKGSSLLLFLIIIFVNTNYLFANEKTSLPNKINCDASVNQITESSDFKLNDIEAGMSQQKIWMDNIVKLLKQLESNKLILVEKEVEPNSWLDRKKIIDVILPPVTVLVAFAGIWFGYRQYKFIIFTRDWAELVKYLQERPQFMDESKTSTYRTSYNGDEAIEYELVARLCIAYLDDMWFMKSKRRFKNWFRGSIILFAGRHKAWLKDNKDSYDIEFYDHIIDKL